MRPDLTAEANRVSEKNGNPIDASGSLASPGIGIMAPSREVPDDKKTSDVMAIDFNNQQSSARRQVPTKQAAGPRTELGK